MGDNVTLLVPRTSAHRHRILVCVDGSHRSDACLPHAIAIAKSLGSKVSLVYVMQPPRENGGTQPTDALGWEISRHEGRNYLEGVERELSQSLEQPVDVRLEQGRIAERIIDVAKETQADLIVLGRGGDGTGARRSLGSIAQYVLAEAQSSVLVADSDSLVAAQKCMLVPLDGSVRAESVLPLAAQLANAAGAELLLIHIVREPLPTALLSVAQDMALARTLAGRLESNANQYLERLKRQIEQAHRTMAVRTVVVRHPNECQCLAAIAHHERGTLIVLSAHGAACDPAQAAGSVTTYFVAHSSFPLLVMQDVPLRDRPGQSDADGRQAPSSLHASYAADTP